METFINALGGYDSWQFVAISLGSLIIGFFLSLWRLYLLPISVFGFVLLALHLIEFISSVQGLQPYAKGFADTVPILFICCGILIYGNYILTSIEKAKNNEFNES